MTATGCNVIHHGKQTLLFVNFVYFSEELPVTPISKKFVLLILIVGST